MQRFAQVIQRILNRGVLRHSLRQHKLCHLIPKRPSDKLNTPLSGRLIRLVIQQSLNRRMYQGQSLMASR